MTTIRLLVLAALAAMAAVVAGVVVLAGTGWGLIAGGVLTLAGVVMLYDPNGTP